MPAVDDGSDSIETSLEMLEIMKNQGITDVIATPHFYAYTDNLEEYQEKISNAYKQLQEAIAGKDLPNILLGCEMYYFKNISTSSSLTDFCLNKSKYLLLELPFDNIGNEIYSDIIGLQDNHGITPIIAHIERYHLVRGFKKLLSFLKSQRIPTQFNTSSLNNRHYKRISEKLIKNDYVTFLGTDSHSVVSRPPYLSDALDLITERFGEDYSYNFTQNSKTLYRQITAQQSGDIII